MWQFFKAEAMGVVIETCIKYPGGLIVLQGGDDGRGHRNTNKTP
jgi:hypothetical protein